MGESCVYSAGNAFSVPGFFQVLKHKRPFPASRYLPQILTSGRTHLRHFNIRTDACALGIKYHAVMRMERRTQRLVRAEMHITRQQHFEAVVAVALTKQIGVVAESLNHLTVEVDVQWRIAVDL